MATDGDTLAYIAKQISGFNGGVEIYEGLGLGDGLNDCSNANPFKFGPSLGRRKNGAVSTSI